MTDLKMQIIKAIAENDKEKLRELKQQLDRNKWMKQWGGKGIPVEAWLNNDNPFVAFID